MGPTPDDPRAARAGTIAFLDAMPETWPSDGLFEIDIITRHHDPEAFSRQKTPLDADDPNPVHFLVVKPDVAFVFRLLPLGDATDSDLDDAWRWLAAALGDLGAGAKTAVGYGEMVIVEEPETNKDHTPLGQARALSRRITKENAVDEVPRLLGLLAGVPGGQAVIIELVDSLNSRWVRRRSNKGANWAVQLLGAAEARG
ncbi:MAG: type III-B CRISPR module RAMP protein Cmr6, partial [Oligoflexia bacterium]|nr:type III-B CRISPR module RAMP protein Cmr6 [Oligoflexia bacterium]